MRADCLAAALSERLAAVLPDVVYLEVVGAELEVGCRDGSCGRVEFDLSALLRWFEPSEAFERTCFTVLDQIQDFVVEATAEPWPGDTVMPSASVSVRSAELQLAYVYNDGQTALALPTIALS